MRLFFALWPDDTVRRALSQWAKRSLSASGGRAVHSNNLHATLVFVGEVDPARRQALCAAARTLRAGAFELVLDHVGYWRHNRIVYAGASAPPDPLVALAAGLAREMRGAGFAIEKRAFVPHVTLARHARDPGQIAIEPLVWRPREFALIESQREGGALVYRPLDCWTLAP